MKPESEPVESTETPVNAESATCGPKYVITDESLRKVAESMVVDCCNLPIDCTHGECSDCVYDWLKGALGAEVVDKSNNKKG